jgi:hypothetical protein
MQKYSSGGLETCPLCRAPVPKSEEVLYQSGLLFSQARRLREAPGASRLADINDQGTATALGAHKALGLLAMRFHCFTRLRCCFTSAPL